LTWILFSLFLLLLHHAEGFAVLIIADLLVYELFLNSCSLSIFQQPVSHLFIRQAVPCVYIHCLISSICSFVQSTQIERVCQCFERMAMLWCSKSHQECGRNISPSVLFSTLRIVSEI